MSEILVDNVNGQWVRKESPVTADGALGMVMPGDMAACNEHNALEKWKSERDPNYVPQYMHPKVLKYSEPEIDRDADRSGLNGIVKGIPQLQPPPVQPGYKIEGRPDNVEVTPTLAYWIARAREKEGNPVEPQPEAKEETPEPKDTPEPVQADGLVPDTMAGIWKLLGATRESFYDFGMHTLAPAGKKPSLDASFKAYRKNMLLTVARALLLKENDRKFTAEQVKGSVVASWRNNCKMKKYAEIIKANDSEATRAHIVKILDEAGEFITGNVKVTGKYMNSYVGQKWCIQGFILWCKKTRQIDFKKSGWRSAKKD